ncbi:conidial yellow pigment biosynthesis polyketide synthase [Lentithecium fluviatile CBS 122367]|uniref:Conidial yellow pigment biosynthesis polyketide synthase n=1 Tax=Lentithecium fluviatile CBS 122367 TaxID=1168545 RepID=A0A6G1JDQ8_9PLEO|nr:conidial yellow pigment biosynthesis polyketide synthase [Lentithecium fluviatile CBS 122367]
MADFVQSGVMMPPINNIIVFGDLTQGFRKGLVQLLHVKGSPCLVEFLARASFALRSEISALSRREQELLPRFTDLLDLVENNDKVEGECATQFALLCLYQLGRFIHHFEKPGVVFPADSLLLGICTGSFAAAAISTSSSVVQALSAGVEAVVYAFRTGWHSFKASQDFDKIPSTSRSWSAVISVSVQRVTEMIQKFVESSNIPTRHSPYISAVGPTNVTISGPPSIVNDFIVYSSLKAHFLSITTPFHAAHLFGPDDIEEVLARPANQDVHAYKLQLPVVSSAGTLLREGDFGTMLQRAVQDALCEQVRWDNIPRVCAEMEHQAIVNVLPCVATTATLLLTTVSSLWSGKVSISDVLNVSIEKASVAPTRFQDSKIAVIGFSGRFPDAASNDEYWQLLCDGIDTHRTIPAERFDWQAHFDPSGARKNTSKVKYGCFVKDPGHFDTRFFRMSPTEAEDTDPAQRLALMTTYEALEMAGFVTDRTPSSQRDRVGVFFGTTSDDWREVNSGQNVDTYFIPGGNRAFVPGRITFFFRFSGPSISVDTACSSSFAALHVACQSLWQGGCDTAIAGGTNILTNPDNFAGLDRGHFLSTTGNCNPFDDEASGYCRADAVASLVLKRLEDAQADNDPIFGVIAGVNTNHCGQTVSITRPHEGDQLSLFKRILRQANTHPMEVNYVEMHGTGTQAGDATEMSSVLSAMVPGRERMPRHPLYLGAVKANVGHSESASGVSALIKVLLMMQHNEIPPHIGIKNKINRNYPMDLQERNVNIAFKRTLWRRVDVPAGKRVCFLNNFSAAGGNTAVLLEDGPEVHHNAMNDPRTLHPVVVSGNSAKSVRANMQSLLHLLSKIDKLALPALSYTTTARRFHHKFRVSFAASRLESITNAVKDQLAANDVFAVPPVQKLPPVVFVFTGQGSLYTALGRALFTNILSFQQDILRFNRIALQHSFPTFLPLILSDELVAKNADTIVAHLGVVCIQMALHNLWTSWGVSMSLAIGHSLGEYPALYAAGVLSATDTIYLVGTRAQLVSLHCTRDSHSMVAVKASVDVVRRAISAGSCEVACFNSPTNTIVSGPSQNIRHVTAQLRTDGLECIPLDILYAFHSAQVDSWMQQFESAANGVSFRAPRVPFLSSYLGRLVATHEPDILNASYFSKASRSPVNFIGALEFAKEAGLINNAHWLEIGAHPTCSNFIKQTLGMDTITLTSLKHSTDPWETLVPSLQTLFLAGFDIDWNEYHRSFPAAQQVLQLPKYNWDLKNYWIMYRGNFCLTKGDHDIPEQNRNCTAPAPILSSSVHRVLEEQHSVDQSNVVTESNIHDPRLYPIFSGHLVNGVAMCPSSLYADMAFTVVRYLLRANGMLDTLGLDCTEMNTDRSLTTSLDSGPQSLRVSATAYWTRNEVLLSYYSINTNSQRSEHAACRMKISHVPVSVWLSDWKRLSHLVHGRISALRTSVDNGHAHKLKRGMAYKLFSSIVTYEDRYQGMQEVVMDSSGLEATARVRFQVDEEGFDWNPCWIDSLGHIAGFIMNSNDAMDHNDYVFINHGWSAMRCACRIEQSKTYHTYNKMNWEDDKSHIYVGDTYILEGDAIVAIFEGVKFQRVPRLVLSRLLPPKTRSPPIAAPNCVKPTVKTIKRPRIVPLDQGFTPYQDSLGIRLKSIVSQEIGVPLDKLDDDTPLIEHGMDSLLSLTIASRLQDDLGINLSSTAFVECSTLREMIGHTFPSGPLSNTASQISIQSVDEYDDQKDGTDATSIDESESMVVIRQTIAQEVGVSLEELTLTTDLSELGIDSLLSLTIVAKLGELGIEVPSTLLAENQTLQEIETVVVRKKKHQPQHVRPAVAVASEAPYATSVRLQGPSSNPKNILFLFPDGAGSATSYSLLPSISPDTVVYGLNCPWLKTPQDLRCSLPQYVSKFVTEVRRRQPTGPYILGGWSAGGILAYEAADQLGRNGETTSKLFLFDTPDPIGIQSPPQRMYDFLESQDMFGLQGRKPPEWLRPHFTAFIKMLDQYRPSPFKYTIPVTHIVYARDGLCKNPDDPRLEVRPDDPREMIWLLNNRTDFSGGGWRTLIKEGNLRVSVVDNANHYSMLTVPGNARIVSELVAGALVL